MDKNDPKHDLTADLDAAGPELERFRRPRARTAPAAAGNDLAESGETAATESHGLAADAPSDRVSTNAHQNDASIEPNGLRPSDIDEDLFVSDPPATVEARSAAPHLGQQSLSEPNPVLASEPPADPDPAGQPEAADLAPDDRTAGRGDRLADVDVPGQSGDGDEARAILSRALSDVDGAPETATVVPDAPVSDPAPNPTLMPEKRSPPPNDLMQSAEAPTSGGVAEPPTEPSSLPPRIFGLKRALDAHRIEGTVDQPPSEPKAQPEVAQGAVFERAPVHEQERQLDPSTMPAAAPVAVSSGVAAGAAPAERKGWFSRRKSARSAHTPLTQPAFEAAPAPAEKSDPFAAMAAVIAPRPRSERKNWFASKSEPAMETVAAREPSHEMVDLGPVREAMQAVALKRSDASASDAFVPAAEAGVPRAAPATSTSKAGRVGVLLINLGTPDAPEAKAVRRYLREFLSDRRVIEKDSFAWQLVFRGIILPLRPRSKARAYRAIWNREKDESPLKTITRSQAEKIGAAFPGSDTVVSWAMRYGNPSIESGIKGLIAQGCERILLVPLYPQYSSATTATVCDEAFRVLSHLRNQPALRVAPPYFADPAYIEAVASSIEAEFARLPFEPEVVLASYHGMPLEYVQKGDPYLRHCTRTTDLLRERLRMNQANFVMTFQSRFGRAEWLQPYTDQTLRKLAKDGVKNVAVVTPGFAADCLETLEEIAIENAHIFKKKGGKSFTFVPCLNDSERGMSALGRIVARELNGWV